ncbi:hypothetical protein [Pedobacter sp. ASV28]|uniref:hypothetical protein n=1 Tax=Pedobacter sp. ASV28 TaxID=2795123 RepID=UPI0018ECB477|nr:hypothetical protein [Pedobacter sp. ASV28]
MGRLTKRDYRDLYLQLRVCVELCMVFQQDLLAKKVISCKEIIAKYYVSERTLHHFRREGKLVPIIAYSCRPWRTSTVTLMLALEIA